MPKSVEDCVRAILANPDFKSKKKGRTREQSAWAICNARYQERKALEKRKK